MNVSIKIKYIKGKWRAAYGKRKVEGMVIQDLIYLLIADLCSSLLTPFGLTQASNEFATHLYELLISKCGNLSTSKESEIFLNINLS